VPQYILAVAGAKMEPPKHVQNPLVQTLHVGFLGRFLALLLDDCLDFLLRFTDQLFDSRRMDSAIGNQLVQ
jgi:hypothetical protein